MTSCAIFVMTVVFGVSGGEDRGAAAVLSSSSLFT
jgi:hypothetical protein